MIFDEPSDQVEGVKLFVPVVIVGEVLNQVLDGDLGAIQRGELFFGCIIGGFVVDLVGFLFGCSGRFLDRERLFGNRAGRGLFIWLEALPFGQTGH